MSKQIMILKEFRKYESELYDYLFGFPSTKENITFYFIPKDYIINFCKKLNFSNFSDELDNLIIYLECPETKENKIIKEGLIKTLNDKMDNSITLEKIKNEKMIQKYISKEIFYMKFTQEGSFVPLTEKIWKIFSDYYNYDILLTKTGFINEGEIFVLTEEEKKIDCFFTLLETKDIIYHYCFIMDNLYEYEKVINYFKKSGPEFSARYLIYISKIDTTRVSTWSKFRIKINSKIQGILNYDITIYFIDSFFFNKYEGKNYDNIQTKNKDLFNTYKERYNNIINLINNMNNNQ